MNLLYDQTNLISTIWVTECSCKGALKLVPPRRTLQVVTKTRYHS
uniref:Uncharacterized protein n=1 Tax=Rhizophora mucronata TaxID=61149 RepID=A0A2P2QV90_RHIMU